RNKLLGTACDPYIHVQTGIKNMHRFFVEPELLVGAGAMNCAPTTRQDPTVGAACNAQFIAPSFLGAMNWALHAAPTIILPAKLAHQVRDVLHIGVGEQLMLLDNSGDEFVAEVIKSNRTGVEVQLV